MLVPWIASDSQLRGCSPEPIFGNNEKSAMGEKFTYRLFTTGDPSGFASIYVGRVPDGRGLVVGEGLIGWLAIWFDATGQFLGTEVVPLRPEGEVPTTQIQAWFAGVGFRSEPVEVEDFDLDEPFSVGFSPYPDWLEPLAPDADLSDPDILQRAESLRKWDEDGSFVFHWDGRNLYLDKHGGYST